MADYLDLDLACGLARADNPPLKNLRIYKPKTGDVLDIVNLVGPELGQVLLKAYKDKKAGKLNEEEIESELIAAFLQPETLDGCIEILARLCGLDINDMRRVDLEDMTLILASFLDFFPKLQDPPQPPSEPVPM